MFIECFSSLRKTVFKKTDMSEGYMYNNLIHVCKLYMAKMSCQMQNPNNLYLQVSPTSPFLVLASTRLNL